MKNILDKKVTGSLYKGLTWREFAHKIINKAIPDYAQPIEYNYLTDVVFEAEQTRFGLGDDFWAVPNNIEYLKQRFVTMDKNSFFIVMDGRKTRLPPEVITLIVEQL